MKQIIFMFITTLMLSCSSDSESNNSSNNGANGDSITPPTWIQGIWLLDPGVVEIGYEFRTQNFCSISAGIADCWQERLDQLQDTPNTMANAYQEISSERYYLEIDYFSYEYKFEFQKLSENQIAKISITGNQEGIYTRID